MPGSRRSLPSSGGSPGLSASPSQKHVGSGGGRGKISVQTPASCGASVFVLKLHVY